MNEYQRRAASVHALAHPVRLQILEMLARHPTCVCDLVSMTRRRQAYVSQQLSVLRATGLVNAKKDGLYVCYQLAWPEVGKLLETIRFISTQHPEKTAVQHEGCDLRCRLSPGRN
jgi:ArsR family transcriptional regulator